LLIIYQALIKIIGIVFRESGEESNFKTLILDENCILAKKYSTILKTFVTRACFNAWLDDADELKNVVPLS
jgi:hypothetical protein